MIPHTSKSASIVFCDLLLFLNSASYCNLLNFSLIRFFSANKVLNSSSLIIFFFFFLAKSPVSILFCNSAILRLALFLACSRRFCSGIPANSCISINCALASANRFLAASFSALVRLTLGVVVSSPFLIRSSTFAAARLIALIAISNLCSAVSSGLPNISSCSAFLASRSAINSLILSV